MTGGASPRRAPIVAAWTGLSLAANGYVFGLADHGIHLPFADMVLHADRWQGDLLGDAFAHHHSFLWHLQAPFAALLGLPLWTALLHLVALAATGLTIHLLAEALFESPRAPTLALLLLALGQPALGGADVLDPLLLNRGVALPLELAALWLFLRGRAPGSFILLGVAAWIHVPSAVALAFALGLAWGVSSRQQAWRERAIPLLFAAAAAPLLLRWLIAGDAVEGVWRVDPEWRSILEARLAHHLAPGSWPLRGWLAAASWLALGGVGLLRERPRRGQLGPLVWVAAGLVGWSLLAGLGAGSLLGVGLGLQLEPWQAWRLVVVLAALAGAGWLAQVEAADLPGRASRGLVVLLFAVGQAPLGLTVLALVALAERSSVLAFERWQVPLLGLCVGGLLAAIFGVEGGPAVAVVLLAVVLGLALPTRVGPAEEALSTLRWAPLLTILLVLWSAGRFKADGGELARLLPLGEPTEEAQVAAWLRQNTEQGALVAVPPHRFESERWRARRPFFVTWKDGGEALFDRGVALEWRRRLEVACACRPLEEPLPQTREPGVRLAELRLRIADGLHRAEPAALAEGLAAEGVKILVLWSYEDEPEIDAELLWRSTSYHVYALGDLR